MFYFFSKLISYFITPAGWLFATLLLARFGRSERQRRQWVTVSLVLFWLCGNGFLSNELMLAWEVPPQPLPTFAPTDSVRVAVVLTGGMINPQRAATPTRPLLAREADRAGQALFLYKTGVVNRIIISGGQGNLAFMKTALVDEGQAIRQFFVLAGVRSADVVLENQSKNTHENAEFSARLLRKRFKTNRCMVVTSAWHTRRAVGCFAKAGLVVQPFPGAFLGEERTFSFGNLLLPSEKAFGDAFWVLREVIGYVAYWVAGYV
jgi:uncharacterized SAM-binding protein YcdF (DUF218 family)